MTHAEVTLRGCRVNNAHEGICTFTNYAHERMHVAGSPEGITRLTASDTIVSGCRVCGLRVERSSEVDLSDCEFNRSIVGMTVSGNGASRVRAQRVRCVNNSGRGVKIGLGAQVEMSLCEIVENKVGVMNVDGAGTRLLLSNCRFDGEAHCTNGGKVEVTARVLARAASRPSGDDLD